MSLISHLCCLLSISLRGSLTPLALKKSTCCKSKELITPYLLFGVANTSPLKFSEISVPERQKVFMGKRMWRTKVQKSDQFETDIVCYISFRLPRRGCTVL